MSSFGAGSKIKTIQKSITFTGASGLGLAGTAVPLATVTGRVIIHGMLPYCTNNLTEAQATAQISLGTTTQVTRFIGNTNSTAINTDEWWLTTTPTAGSLDLPDAMQMVICSENLIINPITQNTNGGTLVIDILWEPITSNGAVT